MEKNLMSTYLEILDNYKDLMEESLFPYHSKEEYEKYFGRVPKFRYHTLKYCLNYFFENDFKTIVELGTSRSFVDGKFPGCNEDDSKYWEPENPEKWDWSAGCFTRLIGEIIQDTDIDFITVDLDPRHIRRSKIMTEGLSNIEYYVLSSEEFLDSGDGQIDFLYMDTGDMTPIENTAQLHLRESKLIVEKNLISDGGILLIDDVRSPVPKIISNEESDYGKAKYSIPYLQENGFEIVMDEYQVVMIKQ
jgi:hypothetical protein